VFTVILTFLAAAAIAGIIDEGSFTYKLPDKWIAKKVFFLKYRVIYTPGTGDFPSTINIVDVKWDGTAGEYSEENTKKLEKSLKLFRVVDKGELTTDDGLKASMTRFTCEHEKTLIRQTQYFFKNIGRIYIITCTSEAADEAQFDSLFEKCVKTFSFKDKKNP
jgi:hypothetical protein